MADAHLALIRFGLGPRPGEAAGLRDPHAWLVAQSARTPVGLAAAFGSLPTSTAYFQREIAYLREVAAERMKDGRGKKNARPPAASAALNDAAMRDASAQQMYQAQATSGRSPRPGINNFRRQFGADLLAETRARYSWSLSTPDGFSERLTRFWSNHFAVSLDKRAASLYAMPMEREAIRPRVSGRFEDLLVAVVRHPAMLRYLDNVASVGDDSPAAKRGEQRARQANRKLGINENLAREIMELHTLGVDGGYTQADVTEFAQALTGWSMPRPRQLLGGTPTSAFAFNPQTHEPGPRTVLGKRYAESGEDQARAILHDLARHPATAKHVATKLARHFVADTPPPVVVDRLTKAYLASDGQLSRVYRALIDSPEAWNAANRKLRQPDDWLVAALRAGGVELRDQLRPAMTLLARMGQPTLTPRSPAGYSDLAEDWSGADALLKRVQAAQVLADWIARDREPLTLAEGALGPRLDADTSLALRRADSPQQAYALLFASPAFQWR
jgi:uncharacterized protein (DUF1800 family)